MKLEKTQPKPVLIADLDISDEQSASVAVWELYFYIKELESYIEYLKN